MEKLARKLSGSVPSQQILTNERMSAHTTFRVGGAADLFVEISTEEQLRAALEVLRSEGLSGMNRDFYLVGNGSNLLVSDKGLRGVVLHLSKDFSRITAAEGNQNVLLCEAGATLAAVARAACERALTGFEFAAGIPGSLGGAIVMNAGAYGGEMKQVVKGVRLMTPEGTVVEKDADEMQFSYRHSILKEQDFIVISAQLALERGNPSEIRAKMEALAARRRQKQPLEYASAGSTFKRPEGYFAAKLIEDAGLRGFCVGNAQVSEKHCGFVVNKGNATAQEIRLLIENVQKRVYETAGVTLEPEVIFLGQ